VTAKRRGRPSGLIINPVAFAHLVGKQSHDAFAKANQLSASHLSEMLAGDKGATKEVAERISAALGVEPAVLFPELVAFRIQVRQFTAERLVEAS
jgi:hypothetical protein